MSHFTSLFFRLVLLGVAAATLNVSSIAGRIPVKREYFHYHDNHIMFKQNVAFRGHLKFVEYRVRDYYVTVHQDPDHLHHFGEVIPFTEHKGMPALMFRVGRHAKRQTADWWNYNIPAHRNTFNRKAGHLNFAFIGDMVLQTTLGEHVLFNFTLPNVGLAQGHEGTSNNWWFGGKTAQHLAYDPNAVRIQSYNPLICIAFKRGKHGGATPVDVVTADTYAGDCDML